MWWCLCDHLLSAAGWGHCWGKGGWVQILNLLLFIVWSVLVSFQSDLWTVTHNVLYQYMVWNGLVSHRGNKNILNPVCFWVGALWSAGLLFLWHVFPQDLGSSVTGQCEGIYSLATLCACWEDAWLSALSFSLLISINGLKGICCINCRHSAFTDLPPC